VCVVLTTHELDEAEKMADRIVILSSGRVVLEGTPQGLTAATSTTRLTFGAPAGLDTASLAAALGGGARVEERAPGRYDIEGASGPEATAALATWLAARQATLTDLVTGRTLEDVYFEAVGTRPVAGDVVEGLDAGAAGRRGRRGGRRPQRGDG
jgi:ABC-2 type transport system ATP-binding protein